VYVYIYIYIDIFISILKKYNNFKVVSYLGWQLMGASGNFIYPAVYTVGYEGGGWGPKYMKISLKNKTNV